MSNWLGLVIFSELGKTQEENKIQKSRALIGFNFVA